MSAFYANIILYKSKNNTNNITCLEMQSMFLLLVYNLMPRLQHYEATKGRGILFIPFYIRCQRVKAFPISARLYCEKKITNTSSFSTTLLCFNLFIASNVFISQDGFVLLIAQAYNEIDNSITYLIINCPLQEWNLSKTILRTFAILMCFPKRDERCCSTL